MNRLLRLLTFSSVPAPVVALALLLATDTLLGVPMAPALVVAALSGTWLVYLGERLVPAPEDAFNHPGRTRWVAAHRRRLLLLVSLCLLAGVASVPHLRIATLVGGALLALGGMAYALPLVRGQRLKTLPVLKPLLVGVVWGVAVVVLPGVEAGRRVEMATVLLLATRTLTVAANVLLHDWSERRGDAAAQAGTLPASWTWTRLRGVVRVLLGVALACEIALLPTVGWLAGVDGVGVVLLLVRARREPQGGWRESLVLDLLVAWPLVTALAGG